MNTVTFTYLYCGAEWHTGHLPTAHKTAQEFADQLASIPLNQPTDEIRVWFGGVDDREPDAVVTR